MEVESVQVDSVMKKSQPKSEFDFDDDDDDDGGVHVAHHSNKVGSARVKAKVKSSQVKPTRSVR